MSLSKFDKPWKIITQHTDVIRRPKTTCMQKKKTAILLLSCGCGADSTDEYRHTGNVTMFVCLEAFKKA